MRLKCKNCQKRTTHRLGNTGELICKRCGWYRNPKPDTKARNGGRGMNDKKSCENCGRSMRNCPIKMRDLQCWVRNRELWLSILPTEPGWYWWRNDEKDEPVIGDLGFNGFGVFIGEFKNGITEIVADYKGQWQGPITPKGGK